MEQGLPVNFENTASTWQNMPGMAAFYTGLQNQSAQDNIRMLQEAFAREQAFKEQQRPVELQNLRGAGDLQAAQAMYQRALGRGANVKSELEEQTLPSNVSAIRSKNAAGQVEDQGKTLAAKASMYRNLATLTSDPNIPGWAKVQAVIKNLGIEDPDGSVAQRMLVDVKNLPKILAAEADYHFKNADATKLLNIKEEGDTKRTGMNNATTRYVANKASADRALDRDERANALKEKEQKKNDFNANIMKAKTASEVINRMIVEAQRAEAAGELEWARELKTRINNPTLQNNYRNEMNNAGTPAVTQQPGERPKLVPRSGEVPVVPFSLGEDGPAPAPAASAPKGKWKVEVVQ